jgi:hypothetical protein
MVWILLRTFLVTPLVVLVAVPILLTLWLPVAFDTGRGNRFEQDRLRGKSGRLAADDSTSAIFGESARSARA